MVNKVDTSAEGRKCNFDINQRNALHTQQEGIWSPYVEHGVWFITSAREGAREKRKSCIQLRNDTPGTYVQQA